MGYHEYLRHGTTVSWHNKTRLESGPVTAYLTTTVVPSHKSLLESFTHLVHNGGLCEFCFFKVDYNTTCNVIAMMYTTFEE